MVYSIPAGESQLDYLSTETLPISTYDKYLECVIFYPSTQEINIYIPYTPIATDLYYFSQGNKYIVKALSAFEIVTS